MWCCDVVTLRFLGFLNIEIVFLFRTVLGSVFVIVVDTIGTGASWGNVQGWRL